jgi:hypothetical protein
MGPLEDAPRSFRARMRTALRRQLPWRSLPLVDRFRGGTTASYSTNARAVLATVTMGEARPAAERSIRARPRRTHRRGPASRVVRRWVADRLDEAGIHELRRYQKDQVDWTAYVLDRYADFDFGDFLLVSQSEFSLIRALILCAEAQGVPIIHVPHAPLSGRVRDLPVMYAGVRGEAEAEYYRDAFGVDPGLFAVVGNPISTVLEVPLPERALDAPGVFATSNYPISVVAESFDLLAAGGLDSLVVAPHPSAKLDELSRILPAGWTISSGRRTMELLKEGPRFLLQSSSGVAWESAALGIPTAELRGQGGGVMLDQYPFLRDESVYPLLTSPDGVRDFVARVDRGEFDRERLQQYARSWCAEDGKESAERIRELVGRSTSVRKPGRILDGWAPGGPAWNASPLTASLAV